MMNIELRRIRHRPDTIDGQIRIDGRRVCDCAENAHHCLPEGTYQIAVIKCRQYARKMPVINDNDNDNDNDNEKLPSPNAIAIPNANSPSPSLSLSSSSSSSFTPSLCSSCPRKPFVGINTKLPRVCPMLKPGNGVYHREDGSIIVGEYLVPGCLKHPKTAFDNLYDRIRKNLERGNPVTLTIR